MNATFDFLMLNTPKVSDCGFVVADELKLIPRGTFGGTVYELGFVQNGSLVTANTGDQGVGQN